MPGALAKTAPAARLLPLRPDAPRVQAQPRLRPYLAGQKAQYPARFPCCECASAPTLDRTPPLPPRARHVLPCIGGPDFPNQSPFAPSGNFGYGINYAQFDTSILSSGLAPAATVNLPLVGVSVR